MNSYVIRHPYFLFRMARCKPFVGKCTEMGDSSETYESGIIDARDIPELFIDKSPESDVESNDSQESNSKIETDEDVEEVESASNVETHEEEHPNLVPIKMTKIVGLDSYVVPGASVPGRCNWEGKHCFKIKVDCPTSIKKADNHILFSESRNKLYIVKDCPFKVLVSAVNVPPASVIRVYAAFCYAEDANHIVQRCPTHAQQDSVKGHPAYEHIIQCISEAASYSKNMTGRLSVSVPYRKPQTGETYSSYLFKLTCYNSCAGGINRRPFVMVFNLEKEGITLGRQVIETKVCACPLRDFQSDMRKGKIKKSVDNNVPTAESPEMPKKFIISVKDPELYKFLEQMKSFYDSCAYAEQLMEDDT